MIDLILKMLDIDAGSDSINTITQTVFLNIDNLEIYGYNDGGTSAVTYTSCLIKMNRLGNY